MVHTNSELDDPHQKTRDPLQFYQIGALSYRVLLRTENRVAQSRGDFIISGQENNAISPSDRENPQLSSGVDPRRNPRFSSASSRGDQRRLSATTSTSPTHPLPRRASDNERLVDPGVQINALRRLGNTPPKETPKPFLLHQGSLVVDEKHFVLPV